jgi:hypothetical protein
VLELRDPGELRLSPREIALGVVLAGTSGFALLAYAFGGVPMTYTITIVGLPAFALLGAIILLRRRLYWRLHLLADWLIRGAIWGLAATVCYDVVRPLFVWALRFSFEPFASIHAFGYFITGLPVTDPRALAAGWAYHFWNGISFGMMLAVVRPFGGPIAGLVWGLGLQAFMTVTYPEVFQLRLDTPGFLPTSIFGHAVWGLVLGAGLRSGIGFGLWRHVRAVPSPAPGTGAQMENNT